MKFELVDNTERWHSLAQDWQELYQHSSSGVQAFLDWRWINGWWQHCGCRSDRELRTVIAMESGRIIMIWPWVLSKRLGLRVLEPMGGLLSCYDDALLAKDCDPSVLQQGWKFLLKSTPHDFLELRGVHEQSNIAALLQTQAVPPLATTSAPYIDISQHDDFASYLASRPKKMRQNQRRSAKYLALEGEVSGSGNDTSLTIAEAISLCLSFKRQWLNANGLSGKEIMTPEAEKFLREVCLQYQQPESDNQLCISTLYLNERVISVGLGLRRRQRHCEYLAGFDPELERFGPGRLRMAYGIEDCFSAGIKQYDMLTPETSFKRIWTEEKPQVAHYVIPSSVAGRLDRDHYLGVIRPKFKELYNRLPTKIRRRLV